MGSFSSISNKESSEEFINFISQALKVCNPSTENEFLDRFYLSDAYFGPYESIQDKSREELRKSLNNGNRITYIFKSWLEKCQKIGEYGMIDESEHRQNLHFNLRTDMLGKVKGVSRILALYSDEINSISPNSTGSFFCILVNHEWKCFIPFPFGCCSSYDE